MTTQRLLVGEPAPNFKSTFLRTCLQALIDNENEVLFESFPTKERYTHGDIHRRISGITHTIRSLGLVPGDIVLFFANTNVEAVVTQLGVWFSGASTATINPMIPMAEVRSFLKICKSVVAYVEEGYVEKVQKAIADLDYNVTIITPNGQRPFLNYYDCINSTTELVTEVKYDKDHCLAVMFTSGTTGIPKGAIVSDRNLQYDGFTFNPKGYYKEKILLSSPLYWISNTIMLALGLSTSSSFVITQSPTVVQCLEIITEYKTTDWFTGPAVVVDMLQITDINKYDTSSMKRIIVGGAFVHFETQKKVIERVLNGRNLVRIAYGSTECGIVCFDQETRETDEVKYYGVGKLCPGVTLKVADQTTGEPLGPYSSGELCFNSPGVVSGYINKKITKNELDKDGFWRVGDIGYYDEQGYVHYKSRSTDIIKYRGYQIAPVELESLLQKHPSVIECAVVGKPSISDGELPTAFVVCKPNSNITEKELVDLVAKDVIEEKKLRGGIIFVEKLPKSPVGKVLRRDLLKMLSNCA